MTLAVPKPNPVDWQSLSVPSGTAEVSSRASRSITSGLSDGSEVTFATNGASQLLSSSALASNSAGTQGQVIAPRASPAVVVQSARAILRQKFTPLSKREGVVLEIRGDEFDARLIDLNDQDEDLEATFAIDEISRDDLPLAIPGAVFYWNIGYFDDPVGRRTRISELRFRRLPVEREQDFVQSALRAEQIRRELGLE